MHQSALFSIGGAAPADACASGPDAMLASMRKTSRALVVHEDKLTGGVSAEIAAIITREAFEDRDAPVSRFAALDIPLFLYSPPLEEYSYPGRGKLEAEVQRLLAY